MDVSKLISSEKVDFFGVDIKGTWYLSSVIQVFCHSSHKTSPTLNLFLLSLFHIITKALYSFFCYMVSNNFIFHQTSTAHFDSCIQASAAWDRPDYRFHEFYVLREYLNSFPPTLIFSLMCQPGLLKGHCYASFQSLIYPVWGKERNEWKK